MVPGKKYTPEDFVAIAWARRWFVLAPFVLVTAAAVGYAFVQPNRYRAQSQIIITPQQVPTNFVRSTITTSLGERLQMIREQILSRTRLERIVEEFGLYPEMRGRQTMEDIVEQMRRDVGVRINSTRRGADTGAFTVSFDADTPRTALLVTERLSSLFIRENLEDRAVLADATSQFLDAQLEEARRRLIDHEKKLENYRLRHAGSLPTQVDSNLQGIQTTQMQLQGLQEAANRDRDRRLFLERALADAQVEMIPASQPTTAPTDPATVVASAGPAAQRLEAARTVLRGLELRFKPGHPDIERLKRTIRDLEKEAEAEALQSPVGDGSAPARGMTPAERNRQSKIAEMQTEIQALDQRAEARQASEQKLRSTLTAYQARIEAAPARESELIELMRDYDILKGSYNELLRKSEDSKLAVNLERRQIGEQFKIVDGARLPEKPFSPDRPRLISMGAVAGLGLGLVLVALLEYRDTTLKTDDDVVVSLTLPVLAAIPAMITRAEERSRIRRRRLIAVSSLAVFAVAVGTVVWKLQLFNRWIG